MEVGEIINIIWNLPLYKILAVSVASNIIFLIRIWPVLVVLICIIIIFAILDK